MKAQSARFTPVFLSTYAIPVEDYAELERKRGLVHLDGLHRMISFDLHGQFTPSVQVEAFTAGLSSAPPSSGWDIFCDFDGTIALIDVVDSLLERFAAPSWSQIESRWEAGIIGSRECLSRQIALLDMTRAELDRHLDAVEIDPGFRTFVEHAHASGHRVVVVSDGLDYAIRRILTRHGLPHLPIVANGLFERSGEWQITFPTFDAICRTASGNCKCATVRRSHHSLVGTRETLLIGDGVSDFCAAREVDFIFAKDKLVELCERQGLRYCVIRNFADARHQLKQLKGTSAAHKGIFACR